MQSTQHQFKGRFITILGAGYLGTRLAGHAIALGMHVSTVTRNPEKSAGLKSIGVRNPITAQLHETGWHDQLPVEQDFVVNCVSSAGGGIDGYRISYLEGNRSIQQWAGKDHPGTFLYTGSTSVFPQTDGSLVNEDSSTEGAPESGRVLLEAENLIRRNSPFAQSYILRLGGLYGPGRHYLLDLLRKGCEELPGRGDFLINLLHIDDACSAIWAALGAKIQTGENTDRANVEIFNVTDGNPATKAEIVEWIAEQVGGPPPRFNPDAQGHRNPLRRKDGHLPNRHVDNHKIRETLDWIPAYPTYRDGYQDLLATQP